MTNKNLAFDFISQKTIRTTWRIGTLLAIALTVAAQTCRAETPQPPAKYPVKLVESLPFGDEFVEVTEAGTLRRRYRVWGNYEQEMQAWKSQADAAATKRATPPRTFRLGCIFVKNASVTFPEVAGANGQPLRATFSTSPEFEKAMRERAANEYSDFTWAFTGGEVKCEWVFETLSDLKWTATGKQLNWGCQPRAIGEQLEVALAKHKDSQIDMWVWCGGKPHTENGAAKQQVGGPPYGISYTQWQLFGGFSIVISAPHLPLIVHEVNHRYLDNLSTIEGQQLTLFHGLSAMGYAGGDLGYPDLLAVYRSVYLHIIRPAMWRRFTLVGPNQIRPEPFSGKLYRWQDVADDCWFRLPLLGQNELAQLTGLASLQLAADKKTNWRHFTVAESDRAKLFSPYVEKSSDSDTAPNNLLSLVTESCATLRTTTGHWLIVRPEVADVYVKMVTRRGTGEPLEAAGWINEGVRPLVVLKAPANVPSPEREIDFFR